MMAATVQSCMEWSIIIYSKQSKGLLDKGGRKLMSVIDDVTKDVFTKLHLMDRTIKGIEESEEYKLAQEYNKGLRDALAIFKKHMEK